MSVIAYHLIWTNYGTWLGNDPRGSGSNHVYTPALATLGAAHLGRKTKQPPRGNVSAFYEQAEPLLKHDILRFDDAQRLEVGLAFAQVVLSRRYTCYACAIMPDHAHLVMRKHRDSAEMMIEQFQYRSREIVLEKRLVPESHPVWTMGGWRVFLDSPEAVVSRIRYVENNPVKEGLQRQSWPFVVPYDNWPFHKRGAKLNRKRR
jgi:REP element-mobilizing transposase RayT